LDAFKLAVAEMIWLMHPETKEREIEIEREREKEREIDR
jgi:hypothetical protein